MLRGSCSLALVHLLTQQMRQEEFPPSQTINPRTGTDSNSANQHIPVWESSSLQERERDDTFVLKGSALRC